MVVPARPPRPCSLISCVHWRRYDVSNLPVTLYIYNLLLYANNPENVAPILSYAGNHPGLDSCEALGLQINVKGTVEQDLFVSFLTCKNCSGLE